MPNQTVLAPDQWRNGYRRSPSVIRRNPESWASSFLASPSEGVRVAVEPGPVTDGPSDHERPAGAVSRLRTPELVAERYSPAKITISWFALS